MPDCPPIKPDLTLSRLAATITLIVSPFMLQAADVPDVMKAAVYDPDFFSETASNRDKISNYYVSEKLDGIRAFWTGSELITRSGKVISAPAWFTAGLPENTELDGELWAGRGEFQQVAATVMDKHPNDKQWQAIKYMVFDIPTGTERFELRLKQLTSLINDIDRAYIQAVSQQKFNSLTALNDYQASISKNNGEGLMLHHQDNLYHHGRSDHLLKLKDFHDAEAVVIGYENGKGKYLGKMGAVWVLSSNNIKFKIGSGFSDADRDNPPALGTIINYRYNGYTKSGIPRFARFIRNRPTPDI
ncbi:DNA ligase [uncultured Photobacterium sp.]|uniref:DNA ligase n=1 Tax=uncultured Photobacterium sp. TaxID=173973 RepID=UPI00261DCDEB|nr:DNA ligase [uncultured Photobacterium sp.]